jgi:hypothetical protein
VLVNVIAYGWGSKADVGIGSTEFYAAVTVDVALVAAGAGTGALLGWGLYVLVSAFVPGAGPVVLVAGAVFGQVAFLATSSYLGFREPAIRGVHWFYEELTEREGHMPYTGSPLLY